MAQGSFARRDTRARLAATPFDLIVVGGNLVGAGIALDASTRGLRTALLEPEDFGVDECRGASDLLALLEAPGGGLRPRHVFEVVESAAERQYLCQVAPHLVEELPILLPAPADDPDAQAGRGRHLWPWARRRARQVGLTSLATALQLVPRLRTEGLEGAWVNNRVEVDEAVLALALARTAALDGAAVVLNRVGIRSTVDGDDLPGGSLSVDIDGETVTISARIIVDASVPADSTRRGRRVTRAALPAALLPLGAALVLSGDAGAPAVCCVPDGRHTRLGAVLGPDLHGAEATAALLAAVHRHLWVDVSPADVTARWDEVCPPPDVDDDGDEGLEPTRRHPLRLTGPGRVSVLGGTVTTYRELARQTVDAVVDGLDDRTRLRLNGRSLARRLHVRGSAGWDEVRDRRDLGTAGRVVDDDTRHRLAHRYGGEARVVLAMLEHEPALRHPLVEGLPYSRAEALFGVRYEMAGGLLDLLDRRMPALLQDPTAVGAAAPSVAELVGDELGWTQERRSAEVRAVADMVITRSTTASAAFAAQRQSGPTLTNGHPE